MHCTVNVNEQECEKQCEGGSVGGPPCLIGKESSQVEFGPAKSLCEGEAGVKQRCTGERSK